MIFFRIFYGFAWNEEYDRIRNACGGEEDTTLSQATIAIRMRFCREMIISHFSRMQKDLGKIGGPGKIVQVGHQSFNFCDRSILAEFN